MKLSEKPINLKRKITKRAKLSNGILNSYFNDLGKNKKRIKKELIYPLVISLAIVFLYLHFYNETFTSRITSINSLIVNVVAIQIGFLITSIALIASFGVNAGQLAFRKIKDNQVIYDFMQSLINNFVYNIFVYIILLVFCFLHIMLIEEIAHKVLNSFLFLQKVKYVMQFIYMNIFIFLFIHGGMIFIRSIQLIRMYLLSILKQNVK